MVLTLPAPTMLTTMAYFLAMLRTLRASTEARCLDRAQGV